MSDQRRRAPSGTMRLALLLVLAGAMPAMAQQQRSSVPTVAEQRARVARLADDFRQAEDRVRRAKANVLNGVPLDTIRAGSLVVLVERADHARVAEAAQRAAELLDHTYGSAALRLAAEPIVIRRMAARRADGETAQLLAILRANGVLQPFEGETAGIIAGQLAWTGTSRLRELMDGELHRWLGTYRTSSGRPATFVEAFEELATSASMLGRRCLVGDVAACKEALVMREPDDAPWRWYDAPWRRELVRGKRWSLRPSAPDRYDACIDGDDAACDAVLRTGARVPVEPPVKTAARQSFVALALEMGGRDAFARLIDSHGLPLDERVALAAGVPADSLAAAWRARVASAAPHRAGFPAATAASSLVWILFFAFVSSRSTRWR